MYTQKDDARYQAEIEKFKKQVNSYKECSHQLFTRLRSYQVSDEHISWETQIKSLIDIVNTRYCEKIPDIEQLITELEKSYKYLMEPITFKRYLLLGKTRVGKSNLGNALTSQRSFTTGSQFRSVTKEDKFEQVTFENITSEFVDTQGLDDTDQKDEVVPKLKEMLRKMQWQYHGIIYVMKYQAIETQYLQSVINFLQNLFGPTVLDKTVLVFTNSPSDKRFKSLDVYTKLAIEDIDSFDKDSARLLRWFKKIKFVDLQEENSSMDDDEKDFVQRQRTKEANIFLHDLNQLNFNLSDSSPLRVSQLFVSQIRSTTHFLYSDITWLFHIWRYACHTSLIWYMIRYVHVRYDMDMTLFKTGDKLVAKVLRL